MVHTEQNIIFMSRFAVLWVEFEEEHRKTDKQFFNKINLSSVILTVFP
jgi:hypothetical protein